MRHKRHVEIGLILAVLGLVIAPAMAAEHGGTTVGETKEHGGTAVGETKPAETTPAPAQSATPAPPAVRPILIKFSGEVVQINRQNASAPMLTVRDRYGVTKEMMADPTTAKVMRGTTTASLEDLKQGDQVAVDYTYDVATGKRHVQMITVAEAAAAAATTP